MEPLRSCSGRAASHRSLGAPETGIVVNAPQRKRARAAAEFEALSSIKCFVMLFVMGPPISLCAATPVSHEEAR